MAGVRRLPVPAISGKCRLATGVWVLECYGDLSPTAPRYPRKAPKRMSVATCATPATISNIQVLRDVFSRFFEAMATPTISKGNARKMRGARTELVMGVNLCHPVLNNSEALTIEPASGSDIRFWQCPPLPSADGEQFMEGNKYEFLATESCRHPR